MLQNIHCLTRPIRWILLICLVVSSTLGPWGCTSNRGALSPSPSIAAPPSPTSISLTGPTLSPTSAPLAEPTPSPFITTPEEAEATPVPQQARPAFALRGIWVHARLVKTEAKADQILDRIEASNFNAVFLLVLRDGYAYYDSAMTEKHPSLASDYDLLGYVVAEAHRRGLQVHAWFLVGRQGESYEGAGPILSDHPEWAMLDAAGSSQVNWLNFARPDARQFMGDLVMEVVQNYDVDGVHFDYIRYRSGGHWSFDAYSVETLAAEHDVDLERLRGTQLPARSYFRGNPLGGVNTAEVLAQFDDDTPAVLLNAYGQGKVIVLNWHAERREIAASSEILRRSIKFLLGENGKVYILWSETNLAEYSEDTYEKNRVWLEDLGWEPVQVTEEDLAGLDSDSVLVMPNIYVMKAATAAELARFVEDGGGVIFVDGPTRSMQHSDVRAITGMEGRAGYLREEKLLLPVGESELIPTGGEAIGAEEYEEMVSRWNAFREESVSALVREVYQRVRAERPEVQVSAAVSRRRSSASGVFQDWYGWLADGCVDFVVPMAYVRDVSTLESLIAEWEADGDLSRTAAGLGVLVDFGARDKVSKTPVQLLSEVELLERKGIKGVVVFSMARISDEQIEALAAGPFAP